MRSKILRHAVNRTSFCSSDGSVAKNITNRVAERTLLFHNSTTSRPLEKFSLSGRFSRAFSMNSHETENSSERKTKLREGTTSSTINQKVNPENKENPEERPSLEETIKRMKGGTVEDSTNTGNTDKQVNDLFRQVVSYWDMFTTEVNKAWDELVRSGERKSINKKIHPVATKEGDAPYTGPVDVMIIEEAEHLTAWERMQKRLSKAPIIQDILTRSETLYHESGAAKIKERIDVIREDAKEVFETSQNPWVYRISNVYDTLTAETSESVAVKELRKLDREFTLDDWRQDVVEHTLPILMQWFLEGRINQLKPWLGESVFKRLAAEMKAREQEGFQIDTHVLGIMNSEILAIEPDEDNKGLPIIVLHFMCQQINCVRRKSDGTIVEGAEDDIKAASYIAAFQREYNEAKGELNWKIVDFRFNGAIAYL